MLQTRKNNQHRLDQQIAAQVRGRWRVPVEISDFEVSDGRQLRWVGASWIVELVSMERHDGMPYHHVRHDNFRPTASISALAT